MGLDVQNEIVVLGVESSELGHKVGSDYCLGLLVLVHIVYHH